MFEENVKLTINGKTLNVIKLHGDGLCCCVNCEKKVGWHRHWVDFCYKYNDNIYCFDCLKELFYEK